MGILPFIANINEMLSFSRVSIPVFILIAYLLKYRTISLEKVKEEFFKFRDNTKEISLKLENKNKELMGKQDYEINLATLKERNRIARDIHDNVGHMLTRSILQIGALLALNKEKDTKESLTSIKYTLSEAMDSIRSSVHDLHEESIDLHIELQTLINNFKFCPVKFDYDVEANLEKNLKYCFIAVTKEALSNIINHSNATRVSIIIREHPALYQLVIHDNGTKSSYNSENGIGIKNIKDRVTGAGGNVNISWDKGFRIFISIPKS
ncbi:MAG TPA: histidine kinase [Clostridiaceae bacterium]